MRCFGDVRSVSDGVSRACLIAADGREPQGLPAACLDGCMSRARCMGLTTCANMQAGHASTQSFAQPGVFCIPLKTQA